MDGTIVIGTSIDTKEFDSQIHYIERKMLDIEDKLKQADMGFEVGDAEKLETEYERLGNQLISLKEKQDKYNQSIRESQMAGFNKIKESVDNVGESVTKVTKRIGKMAVAVFGIRSMFMFIRNAINTIADGDDQLKADIEYMKIALAYTLEPIVRAIVDLAKQLMFYIGYVVKAWTGKNIFENANKGLENATKKAKGLNKELSKTLADFDEMQILQDNSSSSGGGGTTTPSFDLTKIDDIEAPGWLKFIVKHKKEILAVLGGIVTALAGIKLGIKGIKALGIGVAVTGIIYAIEKFIDYLKDPSWENFGGIIQGIGTAITGVGIAIGSLSTGIIGLSVLALGTIVKYWDKIKAFLQKGIDWLKEQGEKIRENFGGFIGDIYDTFVRLVQDFLNAWDFIYTGIKKVFDGVIQFIKGIFTGQWREALNGLLKIVDGVFDMIVGGFVLTWSAIAEVLRTIAVWIYDAVIKPIFTFFDWLWDGIKTGFKMAIDFVIGLFKSLWEAAKWVIEQIGNGLGKIGDFIGGIKDGIVNIGKGAWNGIKNIGKGIADFFGFSKGGIVVPKLASGGIINQPGRGVPIASAVGGERGMEGVIPLTDSQQMALLGEAIGKYININATIPVYVGNRQIARELRKINEENDFAFNR